MDIYRITARWAGFNGAPGYSAFHFATGGGLVSDVNQVAERVRSAFGAVSFLLPAGVTINIEPEAEIIDSDTGIISAFEPLDPPAEVSGTGSGTYSAPSGAVVNWRTNDVRFGRRIRGRTFLVPLSSASYQSDGTLNPESLSDLNDFGNALVGGDLDSEFGVWSRPRNGAGGVFATATSFSVPDKVAVLRSRRD